MFPSLKLKKHFALLTHLYKTIYQAKEGTAKGEINFKVRHNGV